MLFVSTSISRLLGGLIDACSTFFHMTYVFTYDTGLTIVNLITPNYKPGDLHRMTLVSEDGKWGEYIPPKETDSRCSCPGLNTLANHGLISRDGRNIPFKDVGDVIHKTFRFSSSFSNFVPWFASQSLQRSYALDTFELNDLDVHNVIEHDASLTRWDSKQQPDQSKPALDLIEQLLSSATGDDGNRLTVEDFSRFTSQRREHSKENNGQFTLNTNQKIFGSTNSSTLLAAFGGIVSDLRIFLKEERFPDGWYSKILSRRGITLATLNWRTVRKVELGVRETKQRTPKTSTMLPTYGSMSVDSGARRQDGRDFKVGGESVGLRIERDVIGS